MSEYDRLIKRTARIKRFIHNCRGKDRIRIRKISYEEYQAAKENLVKLSQAYSFPQELLQLQNKKELPKSSKIRSLRPILQDGII